MDIPAERSTPAELDNIILLQRPHSVSTPSSPVHAVRETGTPLKDRAGNHAGSISSGAWPPEFNTHVSIAMVQHECWESGTELSVETPEGERAARVQAKFWS
ncbi:MAG: hypothetical protein E2O38_16875 [Proteobacteria bacterium]|nr:MAG: hypothetical protein E2O38_16875 [Pseudomonadota bacterium]